MRHSIRAPFLEDATWYISLPLKARGTTSWPVSRMRMAQRLLHCRRHERGLKRFKNLVDSFGILRYGRDGCSSMHRMACGCRIRQYWQDMHLFRKHHRKASELFEEVPPFGPNRDCRHGLGVVEKMEPVYDEQVSPKVGLRQMNCTSSTLRNRQ